MIALLTGQIYGKSDVLMDLITRIIRTMDMKRLEYCRVQQNGKLLPHANNI